MTNLKEILKVQIIRPPDESQYKCNDSKTGLQPVSRPVEQVHYFRGWVESAKYIHKANSSNNNSVGSEFTVEKFTLYLLLSSSEIANQ